MAFHLPHQEAWKVIIRPLNPPQGPTGRPLGWATVLSGHHGPGRQLMPSAAPQTSFLFPPGPPHPFLPRPP